MAKENKQGGNESRPNLLNAIPQPTYTEVAQAFSTFTPPYDRGGIRRPQLPFYSERILEPGLPRKYSKDYHVETSFTPEQQRYVRQTLSYMSALAEKGEVFTPTEVHTQPLSEKITHHALKRIEHEELRFGDAVGDGVLDLLADFGKIYPHLMPAMHALFGLAGAEGMAIAVSLSSPDLSTAITIGSEHIKNSLNRNNFIQRHPGYIRQPEEYEVACTGEALANTIIAQAKISATALAQDPLILQKYNPKNDHEMYAIVKNPIEGHIRAQVATSVEYANALHAEGKI